MAELKKIEKRALSEVFGDEGTQVIKVIKTPMEDKDISAKLNCETSKVRTILNELLALNLVNLHRVRQDTGYTNYNWVRRSDKIVEYVNSTVEEKIKILNDQLSEEEVVFECECNRLGYGDAIENNFSCPDCNKDLKEVSPGKGSRKIKAEMKRLEGLVKAS